MNKTNESPKRIYSFDLIRVIAALAVVMIHLSVSFVSEYPDDTIEFTLGNIFDSLSRIGVPLFFMVSGALMLNEKKTVTICSILKKNVLNIFLLLVIWSAIYAVLFYCVYPIMQGQPIIIKDLIDTFVFGYIHMWYLFAAIGLYLVTPILRCFVKKDNSKMVLYCIILSCLLVFLIPLLSVFSSQIAFLDYVKSYINKFSIGFLAGPVTYYLLGWYIVNVGFCKHARLVLYVAGIISAILTIVITQANPNEMSNTYSNTNILILIYSVATFDFIYNNYKGNEKSNKLIKFLSDLSFGVYMMHIIVLHIITKMFFPYNGNAFVYIVLVWICIFLISCLLTYIANKIPIIKKLVRG